MIGTTPNAYPELPWHLTLAARLSIGTPTFLLAPVPSGGRVATRTVVRVARSAVLAGTVLGAGLVAGHLFALHDFDLSVLDAHTAAVTILVTCGLYPVMALEARGSQRRSSFAAAMCAVLAREYVGVLPLAVTHRYFERTIPDPDMIVCAVLASGIAIGALARCGYSLTAALAPSHGGAS